MKKTVAFVLSLIMTILSVQAVAFAEDSEYTVAFIGGSITYGVGLDESVREDKCYAGLVRDYLKESHPDLKYINAGLNATGTNLGLYRIKDEILKYDPDLVFIEFAVNDFWTDPETICACTEAILHKLRSSHPYCDIVFLYTTTKTVSECLSSGGIYPSRTVHSFLAYRFGDILQIDVGEVLRDRILSGGKGYASLLPDTVHPNNEGHAIYFEKIKEVFEKTITEAKILTEKAVLALPEPCKTEHPRFTAHIEDADKAEKDGFSTVDSSLCGKYPHYIEAVTPGATLSYTFYGSKIDLFCMRAADSGDVFYSIDSLPEKKVSFWDKYCLEYNRAAILPLSDWLPEGEHTLKIRVSSEHAEQSKGNAVRIGAFLVV